MTTYAVDKEIGGTWIAVSASSLTVADAMELARELADNGIHTRIVAFTETDGTWVVADYRWVRLGE